MSTITQGSMDENVKISDGDLQTGRLIDKLVAGSNITLTKLNAGVNETLEIASTSGTGDFNDLLTTVLANMVIDNTGNCVAKGGA